MKVKKIQSLRALHRHKSSHLIGNDKTEESSVKMSANNDPEGEKDKQFVNMVSSKVYKIWIKVMLLTGLTDRFPKTSF